MHAACGGSIPRLAAGRFNRGEGGLHYKTVCKLPLSIHVAWFDRIEDSTGHSSLLRSFTACIERGIVCTIHTVDYILRVMSPSYSDTLQLCTWVCMISSRLSTSRLSKALFLQQ